MKGFIAKLLVLCMVVGLLPVVALAVEVAQASDGSRVGESYTITAEQVTGGVYVVGADISSATLPMG